MRITSRFKPVFWNTQERRLRAGWRLAIQFILFMAIVIGLALIGSALGSGSTTAVIGSAVYLVLGVAMAWLLGRFIDGRRFADFGFHLSFGWWLDLAFGLALGAVLMTGIFVTQKLAGWVTLVGPGDEPVLPTVLISLLVYFAVGVNEEFTFRGYQLRNLAEGLAFPRIGPRAAVALALSLSSGFFGVAHSLNDNATAVSTLNIVVGGLLLGLPLVLTGELAISIGLHIAWNFFQGTVYGFPVSGSVPTRRVLKIEQSGPELWTGGAFGPEAGLIGLIWILLGCGLIVLWIKARQQRLALHETMALYLPAVRCKETLECQTAIPVETDEG